MVIVDMKKYKQEKIVGDYKQSVGTVFSSEREYFQSNGKFIPFADGYIDSDFLDDRKPTFHLVVSFREYKKSDEYNFLKSLLGQYGHIDIVARNKASKKDLDEWEKNGKVYPMGEFWSVDKMSIEDIEEIYRSRESSQIGVYLTGTGMRTSPVYDWRGRSVGFSLIVCGYDGIRNREESHIIENDDDMSEVFEMLSIINRAKNPIMSI